MTTPSPPAPSPPAPSQGSHTPHISIGYAASPVTVIGYCHSFIADGDGVAHRQQARSRSRSPRRESARDPAPFATAEAATQTVFAPGSPDTDMQRGIRASMASAHDRNMQLLAQQATLIEQARRNAMGAEAAAVGAAAARAAVSSHELPASDPVEATVFSTIALPYRQG